MQWQDVPVVRGVVGEGKVAHPLSPVRTEEWHASLFTPPATSVLYGVEFKACCPFGDIFLYVNRAHPIPLSPTTTHDGRTLYCPAHSLPEGEVANEECRTILQAWGEEVVAVRIPEFEHFMVSTTYPVDGEIVYHGLDVAREG